MKVKLAVMHKPYLAQRNELHIKRKIFHAMNGLLIFTIYQFDFVNWLVGGLLLLPWVLLAWGLEIGRLRSTTLNDIIIKYTGQIMRAGEVNKPSGNFILKTNSFANQIHLHFSFKRNLLFSYRSVHCR